MLIEAPVLIRSDRPTRFCVTQRLTASRSNVVPVDMLKQVSLEVMQCSVYHMRCLIVFKPEVIALTEDGRTC